MGLPSNYASIKSGLTTLQLWRKFAVALAVATVAVVVPFIRTLERFGTAYHELLEVLGIFLIILCVFGRVWCSMYIGGRKARELVTSGPYSLSRNPLYMFSFIGVAGVGAQTGTFTFMLIFALLAVLIFLPVIKREEAALHQIFGKAYDDYCARVPRLGPRLSTWKDEQVVEVQLRRIYRTFFDSLVFVALILLFEVIDLLQGVGYLSVFLPLP